MKLDDEAALPRGAWARFARWVLRAAGWKLEGQAPADAHCIVIGAPHTTNWDLAIALLTAAGLGFRMRWLGKSTIFWPPLGYLLRALGGIPVDRSNRMGLVESLAKRMREESEFQLCIAPEGTRSFTGHWKSGFYRIALAARVPVVLGYGDYRRKVVGIGPAVTITGDVEADMAKIAAFYADKRGLKPENEGVVRLLPDEAV